MMASLVHRLLGKLAAIGFRPVISGGLLVFLIVCATAFVREHSFDYAMSKANEWLPYSGQAAPREIAPKQDFDQKFSPSLDRIHEQYFEISKKLEHHIAVAKSFYANMYMAVMVAVIMGAFLAIATLLITIKGWPSAAMEVKTAFVALTIIVTFFSSFNSLFQQQKNIDSNISSALAYEALQAEIKTYLATGLTGKTEVENPPQFAVTLDRRMVELNAINVKLDGSSVPKYSFNQTPR